MPPLVALCICLLLWQPQLAALDGSQSKPAAQSLKERVILFPAGSSVEVKMANKEKLRGRLGAVTNAGFELRHLRNGETTTSNVLFDNVRDVKLKEHGMSTPAKITLGVVVGVGAALGLLFIIAAAIAAD